MKKIVSVLVAISLICSLAGCSSGGSVTLNTADGGVSTSAALEHDSSPDTASPAEPAAMEEPKDTAKPMEPATSAGTVAPDGDISYGITEDTAAEMDDGFIYDFAAADSTADIGAAADFIVPSDEVFIDSYIQPEAGLLTGGEWNDNANWSYWLSLYQTNENWEMFRDSWRIDFAASRVTVKITSDGKPVEGAKITTPFMNAVTDNTGTAYIFCGEKDSANSGDITVEYNGIVETVAEWSANNAVYEYELQTDISAPAKALDLMLMVDTTGSMCDELVYLQEELKDVIARIQQENGNLPIRVSVNFYRDTGDDYVVRSFDFTEDIDRAIKDIAAQEASGGGDTPEAVHTALDNALNEHDWAENSTKLMFLVLDAPPHSDPQIIDETNRLTLQAAEMGVRIIPVASSGIDKATEYLLRTMAFTTGGTYTFLTDDSGIGGGHIEPTVGDYTVEKLNDMMVRIVSGYLSDGERIAPEPAPVTAEQPDIDELMMFIEVRYNDFDSNSYIFTVMEDGSVYHTSSPMGSGFAEALRSLDEDAFTLCDMIKAGTLDGDSLKTLAEYISAIDVNSSYYDYMRDADGMTLQVVEPYYVDVYCCPDSANGEPQMFELAHHAAYNTYYRTHDENALAAYELIKAHDLYTNWWNTMRPN